MIFQKIIRHFCSVSSTSSQELTQLNFSNKNVESLLLNAANDENFDEEFQKVADFYKDDFNSGLLRTQLESLNASFKENKDISRVDIKLF